MDTIKSSKKCFTFISKKVSYCMYLMAKYLEQVRVFHGYYKKE